jgi:N-acetylglucosaminyl-diphospho-decaprenol L-rhamnosyltransferase
VRLSVVDAQARVDQFNQEHPTEACAQVTDVSVVTVLHNSAEVIEAFLGATDPDAEIIVVDNASHDDGGDRALRARPGLTLVRAASNDGFGAGCNLGWARATRPYIAFVNPDVLMRSDTLSILLRRLLDEPHGIVGPALVDEHGGLRPPNRRPSAINDFIGLLPTSGRWAPGLGRDGRLAADDPRRRDGGPVAFVEGACFMIRRADLEAVGGFDPDLFLYFEEQSLTMRLQTLGGRAFYDTGTVVRHSGAHSTQLVAPFALHHFFRSRIIMYRKRDGELRGALSAALLGTGAAVTLLTSLANAALRRPTEITLERALAILRGIVAGIRAPLRNTR